MIKASDYRIGSFEVESALIEHSAVQEAVVVGSPDDIRGLIVKAFVILKPGIKPSEALIREIQNHVKNVTALQIPAFDRVCGRTPKNHIRKDKAQRAP